MLAVVINTTDKYSHIWDSWYYHFKKHWTLNLPVYFLNEKKDITFPFTQIKVDIPEKNLWTKKLRESVAQIPEGHLLILLEDLFLTDGFKSGELEFVYDFFLRVQADALRIQPESRYATTMLTRLTEFSKLTQDSQYLIAHTPNIWKKDFLLECIKVDEDPWSNEKKGTKRIQNKGYNIYHYEKDWFVNVLRKGKVVPKYKHMIHEQICR